MESRKPAAGSATPLVPLAVLALLAVALLLRLHGLDWDQGTLLHPDERHLADVATHRLGLPQNLTQIFDADTSPLNPRSRDPVTGAPRGYAYGSLPLYLLRGAAALATAITGTDWSDFLKIPLVGRVLSALFDTGTVWMVFLIGRRLRDRRTGLLAAAFVTFAVIHIQLAHFYAVDVMLVFLITAGLYLSLGVLEDLTRWRALLSGLVYGLALATKASSAPLLFALAAPYLLWWLAGTPSGGNGSLRALGRGTAHLALTVLVAGATFALLEPYALLAPGAYLGDLSNESAMARGVRDLPYTLQFVGTIPVVYQLVHQVPWTLGVPLGLAGLAGFFASLWRIVTRWVPREAVLMSWAFPYLVITLSFEAKFLRYLLPVTPVLAILGARLLMDLHDRARRRNGRRLTLAGTAATLVLAFTVVNALAFSTIYDRPHPRVEASAWIYANAPRGARLGVELWDDALPLPLQDGRSPLGAGLQQVEMALYDDRPPRAQYDYITRLLSDTDYIVLSSNRLYGSIPRLPWRYPVTSEYYRLLFQGSLGFAPAAVFSSTPGLLGWTISDQGADESFTVYDHPTVYIFKKQRTVPESELRLLFADALSRPWLPTRYGPAEQTLLLGQPVDQLAPTGDYAWAGLDRGSWLGVVIWYLTLSTLGALGLPLALAAGRGLADRAFLLARPLGLLLVGYLTWLLVSLRLAPYTAILAWAVAGALAALGFGLRRRLGVEVLSFLRAHRREVLAQEAIFGTAFLALTLVRLLNPDLWHPWNGGEKPMELAFLNALTRGPSFPPYDPWFSDGYINYYYYGQYLVSLLVKLTGLHPALAFNLAVPTFFAFAVTAACSVVSNLVAAIAGRRPPRPSLRWGLLGATLVMVIGNLDGAIQVLSLRGYHLDLAAIARSFDYWRASRVVPFTINEFPFWSFLFADLHAHLLALPFGIAAVGLLLAFLQEATGPEGDPPGRPARVLSPAYLARPAALVLVLGALACINTWDFPTYLGLAALTAVLVGAVRGRRLGPRAWLLPMATVLAIGLAAILAYLPFFLSYKSFYGGLGLVTAPTSLPAFLTVFGLFLYIVTGLIGSNLGRRLVAAWSNWRGPAPVPRAGASSPSPRWSRHPDGLAGATRLALAGLGLGAAPLAFLALGRPVSALLLLLLEGVLLVGWRGRGNTAEGFALLLTAAGLVVLLASENVYLPDFLQDTPWRRMNTVFKLYLQAWVLLGLGSAVALYLLVPRPGTSSPVSAPTRRLPSWLSLPWTAGLAALLTASLLFVPLGTSSRVRDRFPTPPPGPTLDGLAYLTTATLTSPGQESIPLEFDLLAIEWMSAHLSGTPVVLEASFGPYRGDGSRISSNTGFPTVLGWDTHERQQRYPDEVNRRLQEVRSVYNSPDIVTTLAVLSKYHVDYVYVGEIERRTTLAAGQAGARAAGEPYASPAGLDKLEKMVGTYLDLAYQNPGARLYRVRPPYTWPSPPSAEGATTTSAAEPPATARAPSSGPSAIYW